ncbi:MAG TPA: hypothetical protein VLG37_00305 [Candidatus Saccharimonadales bacterium]|nr:hypothetical protein [Candidatus Saccharimonadales bacterium]
MTTHTFVAICGFLSSVLALAAGIPYISSILRGKTRPHQFSWLILVTVQAIGLLSQFLKGARASIVVSLTFLIISSVVLVLSLSKGTRDTSRYDRVLFGLSIFTIIAWILTKNPSVAIWLTVIIDAFATSMILLKVKADPTSEAPFPWAIAAIAYVFSCLTLVTINPGILYVRPIYGFLSEGVVAAYTYYALAQASKKRGKKLEPKPDISFIE